MLRDHRQVMRLTNRGNSACLTIPRPMMHALGLVVGDHVALTLINDHVIVSPLAKAIRESVDRNLSAAGLVTETAKP